MVPSRKKEFLTSFQRGLHNQRGTDFSLWKFQDSANHRLKSVPHLLPPPN